MFELPFVLTTFALVTLVAVFFLRIRALSRRLSEAESEREKLRAIIETIPDPLFAIDSGGRVSVWNKAMEGLTGISRSDILGKGNYAYSLPFYGDSRPIIIDIFDNPQGLDYSQYSAVKQSGDEYYADGWLDSANGGKGAYLRAKVTPLYDASGRRCGALESISDMSEIRRASIALSESEKKYKGIFDNAVIGIMQSTLEGRFLSLNQKVADLLGYKNPEEVLASITDIGEQVYADRGARDAIVNLIKTGSDTLSFETAFKRSDGSVWIGSMDLRIVRAEDGTPEYLEGFVIDITQKRQGEKELAIARARLKDIIAFLPDATFVIDAEGKIIAWNHAIEEMTGVSEDQMLGRSDYSVPFWGEKRPLVIDLVRKASAREEKLYDFVRRKSDVLFAEVFVPSIYGGKGAYVWVTASALRDTEGRYAGSIESVRDITDKKHAEDELIRHKERLEEIVAARTEELEKANKRLKELDQLKSRFIAMMSHELRTPLNAILGFTGITLQGLSGELNEDQRDNISRANKSAYHLLSVVSDIIDVSKAQAGHMEAQISSFKLGEVLSEARDIALPLAGAKGLTLVADELPEVELKSDRRRLLQCLINLLGNAVKYTEKGEVRLDAKIEANRLRIVVSDTGIGIPTEKIGKLFAPFERLDSKLAVEAGGTGLGLYLTKTIVEEVLSGEIEAWSEDGTGSRFSILIPIESNS